MTLDEAAGEVALAGARLAQHRDVILQGEVGEDRAIFHNSLARRHGTCPRYSATLGFDRTGRGTISRSARKLAVDPFRLLPDERKLPVKLVA